LSAAEEERPVLVQVAVAVYLVCLMVLHLSQPLFLLPVAVVVAQTMPAQAFNPTEQMDRSLLYFLILHRVALWAEPATAEVEATSTEVMNPVECRLAS
jgi:hypothetical protein